MRTKIVGALLAIASLQPSNSPAFADDQSVAIEVALSVCTELPMEAETVAKRLLDGGWASDGKVVGAAFLSVFFAYKLNPDDIAYSLDNGGFMTASILGNSAMPPNQPGFTSMGVKLAILMGDTKQGYCVLSGSSRILEELATQFALTETLSSPVHRKLTGKLATHSIDVVVLDRMKLEPMISAAKTQYVKPEDFTFDEVNVVVTPTT